ncbi:MAG: chromosome segregation protein SMC [Gemmatimonadota bacterium]
MKLTRLELSGFKSFADTVTLNFNDGVTAIVGPNGCGKSNVSDAVRWVLGEQSARLLRGGKMEDVIFQGSTARRPVNVTEVSLFLDNSDGTLPVAYQEIQVTRRLSRSGQSDYLLNGSTVRLRDIQDLLRGTGLGSDAGVVIEAKMIDLLLSDRADERRSLFEEAAGIGLYRDRRQTTERRLEETGGDLQRVEDLIAEVQTQLRSLARQKGKAERHSKLMEEKFALQLTLARRHLEQLAAKLVAGENRHRDLAAGLPASRDAVGDQEQRRESCNRNRAAAEAQRTEIARLLSAVRLELGRLDGDLALAAERLANATARREKVLEERSLTEARIQHAARERAGAGDEHRSASGEEERIRTELSSRAAAEQEVRLRLGEQRTTVRQFEEDLMRRSQTLRALEGERAALDSDLAAVREQSVQATARRTALQVDLEVAERRRDEAVSAAERMIAESRRATAQSERCRHDVAEARRREALDRGARRTAEESLAQLTARRHALEELERDRVGLAPGAAALLAARGRFGGAILGPLSDFLGTSQTDAELAERLLGEWVHAVVVRDETVIPEIQAWHAEAHPGTLLLLPADPGPRETGGSHPLEEKLRAEGPAAAWVRAILSGAEVLDPTGRAVRRANGAIFLGAAAGPAGPLRRRADLEVLTADVAQATTRLASATSALEATVAQLAGAEQQLEQANLASDQAREAERQAVATREDALRQAGNLAREVAEAEQMVASLTERMDRAERRLAQIDVQLTEGELARARLEENLGEARSRLAQLETEQESARDARVHWQVQEGYVAARLEAANSRLQQAERVGVDAEAAAGSLAGELARLSEDISGLSAQQSQWTESRGEKRIAVLELEAAADDAEQELFGADAALAEMERALTTSRHLLESTNEEYHQLELELTQGSARKQSIVERVETEWRRPIDELLTDAPELELDLETLEAETARVIASLEAIGPVNPLAVEEHAEENKRLIFLTTQRDDLVAARQSLTQAIREIDGTARTMFLDTFNAIQANFLHVFQTLFGGGECDLRLANPDDPLDSEIDIHAAPRGKRTQRIHLLSSGERTLVAVSLLFSIYLTKPSPFCLMDEVDAPLDDANVGRFTRLLDEFKASTQFLVITHNPRTMQSADAVYGVTMQEPGVSTIVGVRLGEAERVA